MAIILLVGRRLFRANLDATASTRLRCLAGLKTLRLRERKKSTKFCSNIRCTRSGRSRYSPRDSPGAKARWIFGTLTARLEVVPFPILFEACPAWDNRDRERAHP